MIDIKLQYNPETGEIFDPKTGNFLFSWSGLQDLEIKTENVSEKSTSVAEIAHLYQQGVSPHDMVTLKENGLL